MDPKERELLEEAKKVLERDGWGQWSLGWKEGDPHCLAGALLLAANSTKISSNSKIWDKARSRLLAKTKTGSLAEWNDTRGRTKEEVFALLDEVIKSE